jgi:hypothetical protein
MFFVQKRHYECTKNIKTISPKTTTVLTTQSSDLSKYKIARDSIINIAFLDKCIHPFAILKNFK